MSRLSTVHCDVHGYFVKTNGSVYRPYRTEYGVSYGVEQGRTVFKTGDKVLVKKITQSPYCRLWNSENEETWTAHGMYADGKSTADCWSPRTGGNSHSHAVK